ncbi:hypothetical protein N0V82_007183 [Gnomoniopsis sp. IMI 355080]|nr:hypothetical protein N0V82_007183 [Gnomoniopsis sp. IMI 355080]
MLLIPTRWMSSPRHSPWIQYAQPGGQEFVYRRAGYRPLEGNFKDLEIKDFIWKHTENIKPTEGGNKKDTKLAKRGIRKRKTNEDSRPDGNPQEQSAAYGGDGDGDDDSHSE